VYKNDVPFVSLWAQRSKDNYFDNPINNALINTNVIKALIPDGDSSSTEAGLGKIRILVMDDIVGTQRTFNQLVEYFRERLGNNFENIELRFVFLFTPRQETVEALRPYLLSQDRHYVQVYKDIELEAVTGKSELPYRKSIHYGSITQSQGAK
jgi:hypothetical protein